MKIKQLSVFLENRTGHLRHICTALAEAGINILTLTMADTSEYGILRLIVQEWEKAKQILEDLNATVNVVDVMAIEVPDTPGGMDHILRIVEEAQLGIDYMYAFHTRKNENAVIMIRFSHPEIAEKLLTEMGVTPMDADIFWQS